MLIGLFLIFCAVSFICYFIIPMLYQKTLEFNERRTQELKNKMERVLPRQNIKKITSLYMMAPVATAVACYIIFPPGEVKLIGVAVGFIGGFLLPGLYTQVLITKNRQKFNTQLIDALMIMSSSFRGGLSLVQAMEAVVEEMPDPIAQEFAIVLGENKMGVTLDEALNHLYNRMTSNALQQMITAILLARETGGNLPVIFNRIVTTIRETNKVLQNLKTLTIQGRIQGVIMTMLPFGFISIVTSTNQSFFDHMLSSDIGRALLIYSAISWTIGAFLIWKISSLKDF